MKVVALKSLDLGNGMNYYRPLYCLYVAFFFNDFFFLLKLLLTFYIEVRLHKRS